MRKKTRIVMVILAAVLLVVGLGSFVAWQAARHVPAAYRKALEADPAVQRQAADQMERQALNLRNDLEKGADRWEALFTAEQINGWLAVALAEKFPGTLPESIRDPRVAIEPDCLTLYCTIDREEFEGVVSLTVEPYLSEPSVLALRIRKIRVGALPWSLGQVTEGISQAAARAEIPIQWRQADGDPVAVVPFSLFDRESGKRIQVETLQLSQDEIYVSGTTHDAE